MASCTPVKLAFLLVEPEGGASDKSPIIFCHGLTASKEHWDGHNILKPAADATKRRIYAVDARNHGDSPWDDVVSSASNVDDLLHFMDTIGAKTAIIVGHSMGGATAMRTALRAPNRVAGIVVEDMSCSKAPQPVLDMIEVFTSKAPAFLEQLPPGTTEAEVKKRIFKIMMEMGPPGMGEKKESSKDMHVFQLKRLEDGRLGFKTNMKVISNAVKDAERMIPGYEGLYEGPACFIYGKSSPFNVGGDEENIKKLFPKAELVPIENATHNVHGENRDDFVEALLKYLTKLT